MKNFKTIIFFFTFLVTVTAVGQNNQEVVSTEDNKVEKSIEMISGNNDVASLQTNWFTGAKQEVEVQEKNTSSLLVSKKDMYLQSGFSNKTLLIRTLLKKADSAINATA